MKELTKYKTKNDIEVAVTKILEEKAMQFNPNAFNFLFIAYVEKRKFSEISLLLNESRSTITSWDAALKNLCKNISGVYDVCRRKQIPTNSFWAFYEWYNSQDKKCQYCGITENQLVVLNSKPDIVNKRYSTRGKSLEIDRKIASEKYDNIENLAWSCYWCNNAKTDTFTAEEFQEIGKAIGEVWKKRLADAHR